MTIQLIDLLADFDGEGASLFWWAGFSPDEEQDGREDEDEEPVRHNNASMSVKVTRRIVAEAEKFAGPTRWPEMGAACAGRVRLPTRSAKRIFQVDSTPHRAAHDAMKLTVEVSDFR